MLVSNNVVPRDAEQGHRQLAAILDGCWLRYLFYSLCSYVRIELVKLFTLQLLAGDDRKS